MPVTDFEQSVTFYRNLFDDEGWLIHRGRQYFDCGPVILAVIENSGSPISDHIYFSVANLDSFYRRATELKCLETDSVHGIPSGEIHRRPWGERSFYARDPDGNGLCFVDESTLFLGVE